MSFRIANRVFAPSLFAIVLTLIGMALFVRLGFWQLHRAEEKRVLQAQFAAGMQSTVELTAANAGTLRNFQHVAVSGRYDAAHQILLDNMPSQRGLPGYRVVTPLRNEQGDWVLVDRGWLSADANRAALPDVSMHQLEQQVRGRFDSLPRAGITLANPVDANAPWPRVMSFPQRAEIERALGHPVVAGLVLLDPDQLEGYERVWQAPAAFGPEQHIAYAVQWFAFAATALIVFLIVSFRRNPADESIERPAA